MCTDRSLADTEPDSSTKIIKPPGAITERVAQACDRCRSKKTKCDGIRPQCSNCKIVGLECFMSDRLSRKAYPRGYTELLEERIRELEFQNKKLQKLLDLKETNGGTNATISSSSSSITATAAATTTSSANNTDITTKSTDTRDKPFENNTGSNDNEMTDIDQPLTSSLLNSKNLAILNQNNLHDHLHDEFCNCGSINRPVSIAGSIDFDKIDLEDKETKSSSLINPIAQNNNNVLSSPSQIGNQSAKFNGTNVEKLRNYQNYSLEQINAPGALAAISLQKNLRTKNFMNLTNLIASSIPRSTEETLFIPTLMAKIISVHGFNSKAPLYTSRSIALLKESYNEGMNYDPSFIKSIDFSKLSHSQSISFFNNLNLPNQLNLDLYVNLFFTNYNNFIPCLNQNIFMLNYNKFNKSKENKFADLSMFGLEKFGEILIIITTLVMLSQQKNNLLNLSKGRKMEKEQETNAIDSSYDQLKKYDNLIHDFINSNLNSIVSISSLQLTTLELFYCLIVGDLNLAYQLRGKLITMSQQLRLHRCPTAVLGSNGSNVSKLQQGERRILFWCIYILDSFSALILGVPRLLKDFEIECALPSTISTVKQEPNGIPNTDDETAINSIVINNNKLSLAGKVSNLALAIMRYSKIQGLIIDHIFKRSNNKLSNDYNDIDDSINLLFEDLLESWRKNLSKSTNLFFELDTNGDIEKSEFQNLNENQLILSFLYYQSKLLIYMPLMTNSRSSSSFIIIQQTTTSLLTILSQLSSSKHNSFYTLPIPMNIPRQKARLAILSAKNALEYTRSGNLFKESKSLIASIINDLKNETKFKLLGCLSINCFECLETAIDLILSAPKEEATSVSPTTPSGVIAAAPSSTPSSIANSTPQSRRGISNLSTTPQSSVSMNSNTGGGIASATGKSAIPLSQLNSFNVTIKKEEEPLFPQSTVSSSSSFGTSSNSKFKLEEDIAINDIFSSRSHPQQQQQQQQADQVGTLFARPSSNPSRSRSSSLANSNGNSNFSGVISSQKQLQLQQQHQQQQLQLQQQQQQKQFEFSQQQNQQNTNTLFQQYNSPLVPISSSQNVAPQQEQGSDSVMLDWNTNQQHNTSNVRHESNDFLNTFFDQSPGAPQQQQQVAANSQYLNNNNNNNNNSFATSQMSSGFSSGSGGIGNINSYSDLFMLNANDFAVDGSIGLQMLDFDLSTTNTHSGNNTITTPDFDDRPNKILKREREEQKPQVPEKLQGDDEFEHGYYKNIPSTGNGSSNNNIGNENEHHIPVTTDASNDLGKKKPNLFNWT